MQNGPIYIRQAELGDAEPILRLLKLLDYLLDDAHTESFITGKIEQQRQHPDAQLLVAVRQNTMQENPVQENQVEQDAEQHKVLGFISLHFIPQIALHGDFCRISYLCVDTDVRGEGVGTALLAHAQVLALARHCDRMELHTHIRRELAHRFYLKNGYSESPKYLLKMLR